MSNQWMVWVVVALFIVYIVCRIAMLFKQTDERWASLLSPTDVWSMMGRLSLLALVAGMFLISGLNNNFLIAFYPVRFWCFLIAALLALIFSLGSALHRRAAGAAGVLVFGGLEVYSVVSVYPSYGWILKSYAALCLVLSIIVVARRFRPHSASVMGPS